MERPLGMGKFQFVVLSSLRAAQLVRGCLPKVDGGHKTTVTAQIEISLGKVKQVFTTPELAPVGDEVAPLTVAVETIG